MKTSICFLVVILLAVLCCLAQESLVVRVDKSTLHSIGEVLQTDCCLKLSRDELMKADSSVRPVQRDFDVGRTKRAKGGQESETFVSKEMLEDGTTYARTYIVEGGHCVYAGFGWQVPVGIYMSSISGIVSDYKRKYEMVKPVQKVKADHIIGQDRPCLVWSLADRIVILDWTSLHDDLSVGGYGLIQLVVAENGFAGINHMDRVLNAATNDSLFFLKGDGVGPIN